MLGFDFILLKLGILIFFSLPLLLVVLRLEVFLATFCWIWVCADLDFQVLWRWNFGYFYLSYWLLLRVIAVANFVVYSEELRILNMVLCWFGFSSGKLEFWILLVIHGNWLIQFLLLACINSEFWKVVCVGKHSRPRFSSSWIRWAPLINYIFIILLCLSFIRSFWPVKLLLHFT